MAVVIRTRGGDPTTIIPTARQVVASIDPLLPVTQLETMETVVSASVGQPRLMSAQTALSAGWLDSWRWIGVYGVMEAASRKAARPANSTEEDPDIAGIVPGPQPSPWGDEFDDLKEADE